MRTGVKVASFLAMASGACSATDLGTLGPIYPIREQSFLEQIEQRVRALEASGELKKMERETIARNTDRVNNPAPVEGLATGTRARTKYFDPTFMLDRNVFDHEGRLMYPAGTRKNPLEVVSWTRKLLFFDARDPRQVAAARALIARYGEDAVKPVLVGGSHLELARTWKLRTYYDQAGVLVRKFKITQVPALVSQEGMRLRIDELETPT